MALLALEEALDAQGLRQRVRERKFSKLTMAAQKHEILAGLIEARAQDKRYHPRTMSMASPGSGEK